MTKCVICGLNICPFPGAKCGWIHSDSRYDPWCSPVHAAKPETE